MKRLQKFITALIFSALFLPVLANAEELSVTCQKISESSDGCASTMSTADCQALLQRCADFYDQQSTQLTNDLNKTSQEKKTLQNQISKLKTKVNSLSAQINQSNVMVKNLNLQITETQGSIDKTSTKIEKAQNQIANLLRDAAKEDNKSAIEILLEGNLSDFFNNLVYLESLNSELGKLLENTKELQAYLQGQKDTMDSEKDELEQVIKVQTLQKQESEQTKKQQEGYLKLTEAQYQQQLADKQAIEKKAAAIKSRIFELMGVSNAPTFEEAYEIAKYVNKVTGVRAAFLLAILTKE